MWVLTYKPSKRLAAWRLLMFRGIAGSIHYIPKQLSPHNSYASDTLKAIREKPKLDHSLSRYNNIVYVYDLFEFLHMLLWSTVQYLIWYLKPLALACH